MYSAKVANNKRPAQTRICKIPQIKISTQRKNLRKSSSSRFLLSQILIKNRVHLILTRCFSTSQTNRRKINFIKLRRSKKWICRLRLLRKIKNNFMIARARPRLKYLPQTWNSKLNQYQGQLTPLHLTKNSEIWISGFKVWRVNTK